MAKKDELSEAEDPREQEAEAVEDQVAEAEAAEERRERDRARAAGRKSTPPDAAVPSQIVSKGETLYSRERLIAESDAFLGVPSHVAVAALHTSEKEFLSLDDAIALIETEDARVVTIGDEDDET